MEAKLPMSQVAGRLFINVKVTKIAHWQARWWIAERLLVLASWVAGCGLHVDVEAK